MTERDQLMQGLADAGGTQETGTAICTLFETGEYGEMLRQMKKQRCELIHEMHESQKKIDCIDYLIRLQEKRMK